MYSALTWYLGFEPNGDEGKTMGLAPYGRDKLVGELAELVQRTPDGLFRVNLVWFTYHREGGWLSKASWTATDHPGSRSRPSPNATRIWPSPSRTCWRRPPCTSPAPCGAAAACPTCAWPAGWR